MRIDGRLLAEDIYHDLTEQVTSLKSKGITPHLVVFLIGTDPSSVAYVAQKEKYTKAIGAEITVKTYTSEEKEREILKEIEKNNANPSIHGIIIQLPVPVNLDGEKLVKHVAKEKDIDGFHTDSSFTPPIAAAVRTMLEYAHKHTAPDKPFLPWPETLKVVIVGKGKTGGKPVAEYFQKIGIPFQVIDSKTENPGEIMKQADVIVTTVGKEGIVKASDIKKGAILVGVGIFRGSDGKLHGDYEDEEIKEVASFYTPTPGGVGALNVAMLLQNLLMATHTTKTQP